jgi:hypothetical protein
MISEELLDKFCEAIARAEGFYEAGTVPRRSNNPGDLTDEGDKGLGTIQTEGPNGAKITIYATPADGWAALRRKVRRMLSGASHTYTLDLTLMECGLKWSGDPAWARNVAVALGLDTRATLAEIAAADLKGQQEA